jgi:hypothetical protein
MSSYCHLSFLLFNNKPLFVKCKEKIFRQINPYSITIDSLQEETHRTLIEIIAVWIHAQLVQDNFRSIIFQKLVHIHPKSPLASHISVANQAYVMQGLSSSL